MPKYAEEILATVTEQLADYLGVERSGLLLELGKCGMRACSTFTKAILF